MRGERGKASSSLSDVSLSTKEQAASEARAADTLVERTFQEEAAAAAADPFAWRDGTGCDGRAMLHAKGTLETRLVSSLQTDADGSSQSAASDTDMCL